MDDFRSQLSAALDGLIEAGVQPVFLIIDLDGAERIKATHGDESFEKFRAAAADAVSNAGKGCDVFTYGEQRVVGILPGLGRLQTFALIDRLRRGLPLLSQSFDCALEPDFDVVEYDPSTGVAGIVSYLAKPRQREQAA
jgi:GGDEF domain-containing protein